MAKKRTAKSKTSKFNLQKLKLTIGKVLLYFILVTVLWVLAYRFINPPFTLLMIMKNIERKSDGKSFKTEKKWVDLEQMSDNMKRAAIAGEDQKFIHHVGFDVAGIRAAYSANKADSTKMKGGSTISQQTVKNVFLWPGRSWVRKGFEAYFTILIEIFWSKQRILEVYLNVIEMGDGIYGAEAAAQAYYGKSCRDLSRSQAAMIAACFPNPIRWTPRNPTKFIRHRHFLIMKNIRRLGPLKF
ncbi:monofunctional biosynthetic peptidoglycan transglycosylase [Pedobacter sp. MC2016-15]|uniref:monofunctional biosynthetic peptidoglycan transglycosylase n=1 Tax=Pedobacter sp. MC2016-15 TaxID=2994473 RepID=UPI0022467E04|nr:monofunctional biosynthetic peptidoglycan transglycosylase [Pedobacter sp. MC2016-15]MCX2479060.1 monofunctional biosynthetic peptidoglycan transglycosylase [Pedobacter sp. MC2016-15]